MMKRPFRSGSGLDFEKKKSERDEIGVTTTWELLLEDSFGTMQLRLQMRRQFEQENVERCMRLKGIEEFSLGPSRPFTQDQNGQ